MSKTRGSRVLTADMLSVPVDWRHVSYSLCKPKWITSCEVFLKEKPGRLSANPVDPVPDHGRVCSEDGWKAGREQVLRVNESRLVLLSG